MSTKTKKQIKKLWTIVLAAACVGLFFMLSGVEAKADMTPVEYAYYNEGNKTFESRSCSDYVMVITADSLEMTDGKWYVFDETVEITNRVTVSGSAIIILTNGCEFNAPKGINVASGSALTIYGQTINGATVRSGKLIATGENCQAGIGGGEDESAGVITINGGEVTATGGYNGAGIGGGLHETGGIITINGGEVTATGGAGGAGIGGGAGGAGGIITINGGKVVAISSDNGVGVSGAGIGAGAFESEGSITINGGEVTAIGDIYGAGIGGTTGVTGGSIIINGGKVTSTGGYYEAGIGCVEYITINGGEVTATGGYNGAGIGGGQYRTDNTITITGGKVTATGGRRGAGIGSGYGYGDGGNITITGGEVTAIGGETGAGIGSGYGDGDGDGGNITITRGKVTATGGAGGAGIGGGASGAGGSITINGGEITAIGGKYGTGIGGGYLGAGGNVTINGGKVSAIGDNGGDGIGIGVNAERGSITINGGMIEAIGGGVYNGSIQQLNGRIGEGIGANVNSNNPGTGNLKSGMKWFTSADETTGYVEIASGSSLRYSLVYKENSAYMTASGSAITAKYIDGSGNKQSINLEIKAPSEILLGDDATAKASLEGLADLNSKLGNPENEQVSVSQIQYYDINGQLLSGAPTAKGNYTAKITVDGVTAVVDYAITKNDPVITAPVARSLTYTGSYQALVTGGSTTGGTLMYSLSESGPFSSEIPTRKEAKTYTVYYKVEGNSSYKSSKVYSVSVEIRSASPISSPDTSEETAGTSGKTEKSEKTEVPKPSIFTRKSKDGSETTITIIWNEDGTTTVINENKQADGSVEKKEETRDSKGNGTLKIEKKDADGKLLSSTEGTIKVNKKGTETIKSVTENADGSKEEKTQKTYKRDPEADNIKKVTISEKKTDAAGNTETIKMTAFVGVLGDATVTEKSEFAFVAAGDETEENGTEGKTKTGSGKEGSEGKDKSGTGKDGNKNTKIVVKEERHYDVSVNGRVKLLSLTTDGENVTIPESIELDGMKRVVKSIGRHALKGNKTVKEVALGKNITTICAGAFKNCKNLELIELTGSVKTINKNAFKGVAENAKFVIEASEEDFERIVELLKKSGVSETVTFERV